MLRAREMAGAAFAYLALEHIPFALDLDDADIIEYAERRAHFVSGCSRTFLQRCCERARQQEVRFKLHLLARIFVCLYNRSNSHIFAGRFNNNAGNEHLLMRGQVF
jgi:hypothetical protein